jgi:hypothetical protein
MRTITKLIITYFRSGKSHDIILLCDNVSNYVTTYPFMVVEMIFK